MIMDTGANGFILMPKDVSSITSPKNIDEVNVDNCINNMVSFAQEILKFNPQANIWLGTPEMNMEHYAGLKEKAGRYYNILVAFICKAKSKCEELGIWNNKNSVNKKL